MRDVDRSADKRDAAERALELVQPGMLLGLGSGSTALWFVEGVGRLVAGGMDLTAVATSEATRQLASTLGINLIREPGRRLDLAVDGADEVDGSLNLIKGRGGALFREKLVAQAADRFVVIGDGSKLVEKLGTGPLPVEVLPFLWRRTAERLGSYCTSWRVRGTEQDPYLTDNGNLIVDISIEGGIAEPAELGGRLKAITGVVEHGLFSGLTTACILAEEGEIRVLGRLD